MTSFLKRTRFRPLLAFCVLVTTTAWSVASVHAAINELQVYGIAKFGGADRCGSPSMTHDVHTRTAAAFASTFHDLKAEGRWSQVNTLNNAAARGSFFKDASKSNNCSCTQCSCAADDLSINQGIDDPDVIFVHTHGAHDGTSAGFSRLVMGNGNYDCSVRTDNEMLLNGDLQIAVIKACQSGDYNVWRDGGYDKMLTSTSAFTMWNAFHGDSSCGDHVRNYVESYAESSIWNGVGENWLDEAYDARPGSNNDDCPTSIVYGASAAARENMFENGGWRDRKDTGAKTGSTIWFFAGCNPDNGVKLPE